MRLPTTRNYPAVWPRASRLATIPTAAPRVGARLPRAQRAQRAHDAPADLLEHRGDVGIGGRLGLDKARRATLVRAIQIHPFKKNTMIMDIQIDGAAESLDTRDRSRLDLRPLEAACGRLVT
jgi:hypothetical protein